MIFPVKRVTQAISLLLTTFLLLIVMVGFGQTTQAQEPEESRPRLRVVNASLGLPSADVYVGGTLYFQNISYGHISKYAPVDSTNLRLEIRPAGVKDVEPIQARDFPFEPDKDYTLVIVGTIESIEDPWIFEDNNKEALVPGQARVRIVHASSTTPAVELCLDNRCQTLTYRKFSNYVTLDNGLYEARVRFIGTEELFIYKLPAAFSSGQVYSIFILDPKQGEIKPRIILYPDTGQELPHYPERPQAPYSPGGPGHPPGRPSPGGSAPPLYPPMTGAFLSPAALRLVAAISLLLLGGAFWLARRQF